MNSFSLLQNSLNRKNNKQTIELLKLGIKSEMSKLSEDQINSIVSGGGLSKLLKNNSYSNQEMSRLWDIYLKIVKESKTLTKEENKQCDDLENQISKLDSDKSNLLNEIKLSTNNNKFLLLINKYKNTGDYYDIFKNYLSMELVIYDALKKLKNPIDMPTIKLYYNTTLSPALKKNLDVIKAIFSIINDLVLDDDDVYEGKYNQLDYYILINNMYKYSQSTNNKIFDEDDKVLINNQYIKFNEISKDFIEGLKTLTF